MDNARFNAEPRRVNLMDSSSQAPKQRIAFRTDASVAIGTGHVMRCLTLADEMTARGAECVFLCRPHEGHLIELITQRGHDTISLPMHSSTSQKQLSNHAAWLGTSWQTDAQDTNEALHGKSIDWLIIDHYALDAAWERQLRSSCHHIMVIDDLADRPHDCDMLLDQNLGRTSEDYDDLLPAGTPRFIGPHYALLRPEFAELRADSLARRVVPMLNHILITMGGVDKDNATGAVLQALSQSNLPNSTRITVVLGKKCPWITQIMAEAEQMRQDVQVLVDVRDMARLMMESDLAIGAAGGTSWERCCLGLPTIQMVLAENQISASRALTITGAALNVSCENLAFELPKTLDRLSFDFSLLAELSIRAAEICDGRGAHRVSKALSVRPFYKDHII